MQEFSGLSFNRYNHFSCGIQIVTGFSSLQTFKNAVLKSLSRCNFNYPEACAMYVASINGHQKRRWGKHLIEAGFEQVGRGVRNPNSGNTIYLYVKQKPKRTRKATKKKEETQSTT